MAPYLLPLFVQKFVDKYPAVELKIFEYQTDEIIRHLKDGKIDGGIMAVPLETKELKEEHLFYEPFKIFLSPNHQLLKKKSIEEKDLDLKEAWLLKEGHCLRSQALQLCQYKKVSEGKHLYFEGGSLETLINMVKSSVGFTVLPFLTYTNLSQQDQKSLREFKNHLPVRDIAFVTGPHSMKASVEKALIKVIDENVPKELKKTSAKTEVVAIQ